MRTLLMVATGIVLALGFDLVTAALQRRGMAGGNDGGVLFICIWLGVAAIDFWIGVDAGNAVGLEPGVQLLILALPGALAWHLSRRRRGLRAVARSCGSVRP